MPPPPRRRVSCWNTSPALWRGKTWAYHEAARRVHQNRLLNVARQGGPMTPADLARFEPARRPATLVALARKEPATVLLDRLRLIGKVFKAAKNKHQQQFQVAGKVAN